jgi:putative transposase
MPRRRREFVEGLSVHIHQRGNNRADMFRDTPDRIAFVMTVREAAQLYSVAIHAWTLMTTHFHLIATPETEESVPRMMQQIGRCYVPYFNKRYQRTGGLWEGRYNAHLIQTEEYWLRCLRYVELNPVRAGMVVSPHEHAWTSYHAHAFGAADPLVSLHPLYLALGHSAIARQEAHRELCGTPLTEAELTSIRHALRTGQSGSEIPASTMLVVAS